jgi:hypothetical protein
VVIKSQANHLASNLAYIERYHMASRLVSEAQYYFTQLVRAAGEVGEGEAHGPGWRARVTGAAGHRTGPDHCAYALSCKCCRSALARVQVWPQALAK